MSINGHAPLLLALVLLGTIAAAGAWDVYAAFALDYHSTVSHIFQTWSIQFPILPLAVGTLLGHLFWPQRPLGP